MTAPGARIPVPLLLIFTMVFWGAAFSVTEVALRHTTPAFTAISRGLLGFVVLVPFLRLFGSRLPRSGTAVGVRRRHGAGRDDALARRAGRGHGPRGAGDRGVLLNTAPFWVALIGRLALGEQVTALRALGLAAGFAGVLTIILAGGSASGEDVVIGAVLALVGALGYACAGLLVRDLCLTGETFDVIGITAAQFLCGGVLLIPYLLLSGDVGASDWGSPSCGGRSRSSWSARRSWPT